MFPIVSVLFFFIGTGLFSLYHTDTALLDEVRTQVAESQLQESGEEISASAVAARAAELSDSEIGDKVLPHFIVKKLPVGLAGLLIAAIFAAAMSSVDTSLNSSATLILSDIYQRYINPDCTERQSMRVLYGSTLMFGVVGTATGVGLAILNNKSALDMWWNLQGIFAGGMLGLFLLGLLSKRAQSPQAAIAGTIGILVILWLALSPAGSWPESMQNIPAIWSAWANPIHKTMTIVVGTTTIVLIGMLLGLFASGQTAVSEPSEENS